ncbi:MAG: adenylate/guanylate cyclase domain-containing protein [Bacteroidota bacterium]
MIRLFKKYPKQTDAVLLVTGFILGMNLMVYFKLAGMQTQAYYTDRADFLPWLLTLISVLIGGGLVLVEYTFFERLHLYLTHWKALVVRLFTTAMIVVSGALSVFLGRKLLLENRTLAESLMDAVAFIQTELALSILVYMFLLSLLLNFFRQLGNHFGHGLIFNFVTGRYSQIQEEHRTFMFIDLDHSTALAEQLGHVKYSRFLKKCFDDLSEILPRYEADVYQYVGDEVVLTWLTSTIKPPIDLPALYFDFQKKLQAEADIYREKFGVVPSFKAALHSGLVSITQVGNRRKALAYHGDVLNTTSRVLALASKLRKKFLITSLLLETVEQKPGYEVHFVDTLLLRGKQEQTEVYEVAQKNVSVDLPAARPDSLL